jgi:hypothetical protein
MPQATIAPYVYQPPDILLHLAAQITLDLVFTINDLAQRGNFRLC